MLRSITIPVLLLLAIGLPLDLRAQEISPTEGELQYTAVAPEIDGSLDDVWATSPLFEIPTEEGHMFGAFLNDPNFWQGPDDFSASFRALWDEQYVYLWVQTRDEEVFANGDQSCWRNDSIEFMLDGGNDKTTSYDENDAYLGFRVGGDVEDWNPDICTLSVLDRQKAIQNIVYATAVTDTGWVIEVRVPWENVDGEPANGRALGFNVYVNDSDGRVEGATAQRDVQLAWAQYPEGNSWQNPQAMGTMTYVGGPGGAVANAIFTTSPPTRALLGEEITFDASGSTAPADIVSYEWDFGDGTTGTGVTATHAYDEPGRYVVTLRVTDAEGAEGEVSRAVTAWSGIGLPETPLEIPLAVTPPEIDGEREDAWADAQRIQIGTRANGSMPDGVKDLSAEAFAMWDAENLYVFFDVTDDVLVMDSDNAWEDDAVEVYIDGGYERETAYDANDGQFEMGWERTAITGTNPGTSGAEYVAVAKDGELGYLVEARLPWSIVGLDNPAFDTRIGFEAMVNDDDEGGSRDSKLSWFAPEGLDDAYTDPSVFGTAVLVETISTAAEPDAAVPVTFAIESIYPNPFNPSATLAVRASSAGQYDVTIYNALGQAVRVQQITAAAPGRMEIALDLAGQATGLYLVSVRNVASGKTVSAKALLMK